MGGTLKTTGLSLLAGAILLLVGVLLMDIGSWLSPGGVEPIVLDERTARIDNKTATPTDGSLRLVIPDIRVFAVGLKFEQPINTQDYRYLHIALDEDGIQSDVAIAPRLVGEDGSTHTPMYTLENRHRGSLWINTSELPGWNGELNALYLRVIGEAGKELTLHDLSLHGPSLGRRLASLYDDWTVYEPWDRAAMNTHTGVTRTSSFYPMILAAGWLFLSLGCYMAYVLAGRGQRRFDWRVTGLVFLACWLVMDAAWQQRLFYQVKDTRAQFSGLTSEEKLRIGPDAKIVAFVETLREHIPEDARVFVLSDDDYEGLRTAYYLYPLNVYFRMKYGLPSERRLIRSGDYIAVMTSPDTRYNKKKELLNVPASGRWDVDQLVDERVGQLFRVR